MGNSADRPTYETPVTEYGPQEPAPVPAADDETRSPARRILPAALTVGALGLALAFVWANPGGEEAQRQQRDAKAAAASAAALESRVGAPVTIDGVEAVVEATWSDDGKHVVLALRPYYDQDMKARYLRIDAEGKTADNVRGSEDQFPADPEVALSISDRTKDVTVRVSMGGTSWTPQTRARSRTLRLSPLDGGRAFDAKTGKELRVENY